MNPRPADQPRPAGDSKLVFVRAGAVLDGAGFEAAPGALLLRFESPQAIPHAAMLLAAGSPADVASHPLAAGAVQLDLPAHVLIPGLVNAHTHLDLTHMGPRPFDPMAGFMGWIDMIRAERASETEGIAASVRRGIERSLAAGVVAVGDIAGAPHGRATLAPWRALRESALLGVSYLEFFAIGRSVEPALGRVEALLREAGPQTRDTQRHAGISLGLQPHAPNTVSPAGYRRAESLAREFGARLSTHLSESAAEVEFVARGTGPQRELLERIGLWDREAVRDFASGRSPVEHFWAAHGEEVRDGWAAGYVVAHVNHATDRDLQLLQSSSASVAYCPRASEYFGAHQQFGPHRYRDMLARGINVAIGTDSIVNLPDDGPMSVLDELRLLHRRDGTDARTLLAMGTVNGARALGLDEQLFQFGSASHPVAGVVGLESGPTSGDPCHQLLRSAAFPELLSSKIISDLARGRERPNRLGFAE